MSSPIPFKSESESWSGSYPENWKKFTRARSIHYGILLFIMACWLLGRLLHSDMLTSVAILSPYPLMLVWIPLGLWIDGWKCPRCGQRFSASNWDNIFRLVRGSGFARSITGYATQFPRRIGRILQCKDGDCGQEDNLYTTDHCAHCHLPKHGREQRE